MKIRGIGGAALVAVAATVLAGCSAGGTNPSEPGNPSGGALSGSVTIGVILPLTGAQSSVAALMKDEVKDFAASINANGGVGGKELKYNIYDDQNSPDTAAQVAQRAITVDGVVALTGAQGSPISLAIKEVADRNQTVYAAPAVASPNFSKNDKYDFRFNATSAQLGGRPGVIAKAIGVKKISILYDNGAVGQALKDGNVAGLQGTGVALAGDPISYPLNGTDMSSVVSAAKAQHPDAVVITGSVGADSGLIVKTMVEQGLIVPVIGGSGGQLLLPDSLSVGGSAFNQLPAIYVSNDTDSSKQSFVEFSSAFKTKYGSEPNETVTHLADALNVLVKGLASSGGKGSDALVAAIEGLQGFEALSGKQGTTIKFASDDHNAYKGNYSVLYEVKDGKAVVSKIALGN